MPFLRPASPSPLPTPSTMDSNASPMDLSTSSPVSGHPYAYSSTNPLSRVLQSPTAAHMRNRARRPSSLSLGLDRTMKAFNSSSSSASSSGNGSGQNTHPTPNGLLQPAPIFPTDHESIMNRGRASSSASSMSIGLSPSRRSVSLEDSAAVRNLEAQERANDPLADNEETPNARKKGFQINSMPLRRRMVGMTYQNESEGSLSNHSNGRVTPDILQNPGHRALEDDVNALAVDPRSRSSPMKDRMPVTPPRGVLPLAAAPSPFAPAGPLKPAQLLKLQNELKAPFADFETKSEAAFSRLVQNTSDLASRLRLTINTPSPARKRRTRNWMESWSTSNNSTVGGAETRNWAGRYPESVANDGADLSGDSDSDENDPLGGAGEETLVASRPPSSLGQAPMYPGAIPIQGRSRSGSMMTVNGGDIMVGSFGAGEMGEGFGGMDLDMVSNMSSPVSTPAINSWRDPVPFFSKKRKYSANLEAERQEMQPAKKRKGLSPHGSVIPLAASGSSNGSMSSNHSQGNSPFVFPPQKSPHQTFTAMNQLSMTSLHGAASNGGTSSSPFGGFSGNPNGNGSGIGLTGVGHNHRKSGSMSTMAWSRPGSAQSSPLLRPTSGNGHMNMPPPNSLLLGPSLLNNPTTTEASGSHAGGGNGFHFSFSATTRGSNAIHGGESGTQTPPIPSASPRMNALGMGMGMGLMGAFAYPSNTQLGQYGAPLTSSPGQRPMVKLPDRALAAMNSSANVARFGQRNDASSSDMGSDGRKGGMWNNA